MEHVSMAAELLVRRTAHAMGYDDTPPVGDSLTARALDATDLSVATATVGVNA